MERFRGALGNVRTRKKTKFEVLAEPQPTLKG
jgi:hypothetical protein